MSSLPLPSAVRPTAQPASIEPADYSRRILLAVTGMSPQIVTETLYALAKTRQPACVPTEIHVITTTTGRKNILDSLLHPETGHFHAMLADYPEMGHPLFSDDTIHVIQDVHGVPLPDIRTPEENTAAADAIIRLMATLSQDEQASVYVSIAGGRKTMGFYMGYAYSLYARPQDRLSHVLVSPEFEHRPEFFYPPAQPRELSPVRSSRSEGETVAPPLTTDMARIELAEIPVVRLRGGVPPELIDGKAGFGDIVRGIQKNLSTPPALCIDLAAREVQCGPHRVHLSPELLAWYAWWAKQAKEGTPLHRKAEVMSRKKEILDILSAIKKFDSIQLDEYKEKFEISKEKYMECNAKVNKSLRKGMGVAPDSRYLIQSTGEKRNPSHGLELPASAITLKWPSPGQD